MSKGKKYVDSKRKDRNSGIKKRGSAARGTDAAHKGSHRVVDNILKRTRGRGGHGTGKNTSSEAISRALNDDVNLRIKTQHGNRTRDERRDKRINEAYNKGTSLTEHTTAMRAVQAHKGTQAAADKSGNRAVAQVAHELGKMTYKDGKPGRPKTIKSMAKSQQKKSDKGKSPFERVRGWFS